ncbi:MAG: 16S rRNA (cytosine(1402)-N(4))-methyltransferase RsmH [Buchnera aphidicola (Eriosoma harunire)]
MKKIYTHTPVMTKEIIKFLNTKKNGIYIDATFGYGGHSNAILNHLGTNGKLYAIDRDPESKHRALKFGDSRLTFIQGNFSQIYHFSKKFNILKKINGIVVDLGISSTQLDNPKRGFSFLYDGPLDMRMNPNDSITAASWLKKTNLTKLIHILKTYGEERYAKKIACAIIKKNKECNIQNTLELSNIISKNIPNIHRKKHPATKSFQAIRIFINDELNEIKKLLNNALNILTPGGRLLVISFHSLEDRIVKNFMKQHSCILEIPNNLPIPETIIQQQSKIKIKIIDKITPNSTEIATNKRARSAILRIAELIS